MTKIQNSKPLAFDLICDLEFICNLVLVICYFRLVPVGKLNEYKDIRKCVIISL